MAKGTTKKAETKGGRLSWVEKTEETKSGTFYRADEAESKANRFRRMAGFDAAFAAAQATYLSAAQHWDTQAEAARHLVATYRAELEMAQQEGGN